MIDLQYLNISSNHIVNANILSNCKKLRRLDISNNKVKSIKSFGSLIHLNHLNIANNLISDIWSLSTLKELQYLNVNYNNINLDNRKQKKCIEKIKDNNEELQKFEYLNQKLN